MAFDITSYILGKKSAGGGGGGGSSDFTTATVTVNGVSAGTTLLGITCVLDANALGEGSPAMIAGVSIIGSDPQTLTVPLYKGSCYWQFISGYYATESTGGVIIVNKEGSDILITGDGTITVSDVPK